MVYLKRVSPPSLSLWWDHPLSPAWQSSNVRLHSPSHLLLIQPPLDWSINYLQHSTRTEGHGRTLKAYTHLLPKAKVGHYWEGLYNPYSSDLHWDLSSTARGEWVMMAPMQGGLAREPGGVLVVVKEKRYLRLVTLCFGWAKDEVKLLLILHQRWFTPLLEIVVTCAHSLISTALKKCRITVLVTNMLKLCSCASLGMNV